MRFIGNKANIVERIYSLMKDNNVKGNSIFDFFAGTTSVGRFFKSNNYKVYSSDLLYFSYILQRAYIENNYKVNFENIINTLNLKSSSLFNYPLLIVLEYLNQLQSIEGFIFNNYTQEGTFNLDIPRMYFSSENGKKIDSIRLTIEEWFTSGLISETEYFILLACLIETVPFYSNISGVYAAFQKKWDPRAIKKLELRPIEILINNQKNKSFNYNSTELLNKVEADIFYLDPPYNQRQYAPNYHILETIAKYDNPKIKGVAGLREYSNQKSKFCNKYSGLEELNIVCNKGQFKYLVMSYNSEGIMPKREILEVMSQYGNVKIEEFDYLRYKSNSNGESKNKKFIKEQLYILCK